MKRNGKRVITFILALMFIITGVESGIQLLFVSADNGYGIINKDSALLYGNQLKDRTDSISYDLYTLMKNIEYGITEIEFTFDTPIVLAGTNRNEVFTQNADLIKKYSNDIQSAIDAFIKDYPEIFWIDFTKTTSNLSYSSKTFSDGTEKWSFVSIKIIFVKIDSITESECGAVYSKLNDIIVDAQNLSKYDKLKYYHDYLCNNIVYDVNSENIRNIYGALIGGGSVCEGYAESFKVLCDLSSIPCVLVMGYAGSSSDALEYHLWNYCMMDDGNWYAVDPTWDDQPNLNPPVIHEYFLCGSKSVCKYNKLSFENSHFPIGDFSATNIFNFTYPVLNLEKYVLNITQEPTTTPTATPTIEPTTTPTIKPTATPTIEPTATPTIEPIPSITPTPGIIETHTPIPTATDIINVATIGDLNEDKSVNGLDALEILKIAARINIESENLRLVADVDGNDKIDATDALYVLKYAAKIIERFPVENNN